MRIGNDTYTIQPGEVLIVRAGQVFSFQSGNVNTSFLGHFHNDFLLSAAGLPAYEFLQLWGSPFLSLEAAPAGFVRQLLHRLLVEYDQHRLRYSDVLRAYLLALLSELDGRMPPAFRPITQRRRSLQIDSSS